jgi:hypothetical protein
MSRKNGDKSRFNRERKQKIARRQRNRKFFDNLESQKSSAPTAKREKVV